MWLFISSKIKYSSRLKKQTYMLLNFVLKIFQQNSNLQYRTVQYGAKPSVLTPDGLDVTNITQEDLTITFKGSVGPSGL